MRKVGLLLSVIFAPMFFVGAVFGADLTGVANVNVTSDTAVTAKNMAFDEARRQIILDKLGNYADRLQLRTAVRETKSAGLMDLIASSSIEGEQTSDTTYSARITMTLDGEVAKKWLDEKGVHNWLNNGQEVNVSQVKVVIKNGLRDWANINAIARKEGIEFATKNIFDGVVLIEIPASKRKNFTIAVRENGWRYADEDGVLKISR